MGPRHGRKSIVVFSESFVRGTIRAEEDAALRASQAANTAVYLVDAKGLVADPLLQRGASKAPLTPIDLGTQPLDGGLLDAEYLADATGGRILRNNNDLTSGLGRIIGRVVGLLSDRVPARESPRRPLAQAQGRGPAAEGRGANASGLLRLSGPGGGGADSERPLRAAQGSAAGAAPDAGNARSPRVRMPRSPARTRRRIPSSP